MSAWRQRLTGLLTEASVRRRGDRLTVRRPRSRGPCGTRLRVTCALSRLLRGGAEAYASCLPLSLAQPGPTRNLALWLCLAGADRRERGRQAAPTVRAPEGPL
ncbi:unnamed protein product [Rangifer tarandus platyrhynchus]|uniref:Uncharacterized protein n=2 Tax=Rangifer tarandus platyrhynchus TaxID=3082113 RepID=A0ACB0DS45_RANTA|nr:unnamed protein product [Rangifer tarandus platyrhynchus]CAI9691047.1 unnamed protein product [Rangifer tarandus platyrhynchus]